MGIFRRRPQAAPATRDESRAWALPNGMFAPSGVASQPAPVTLQSALQNAGAWACQRVLISTISMLPVDAYRTLDGRLVELPTQPAIVSNPSGRVSRRGWVAQCMRSGTSAGNIYGRVVAINGYGTPAQIETVHPDDVQWFPVDGEEVAHINGKAQTEWRHGGDFWHVPISQFLQPGSRVAMNPTMAARTAIGTGIAAENYGSKFFTSPQFLAKVATEINADQAQDIKNVLIRMANGGTDPGVIGNDIALEKWMVDPKDSQFIDLLRFEVEQACRFWGVPPSMVYAAISGQNITYSNISQADLQFLKYSVQSWVSDLEDAWSEMAAMPHSVRFNTDAVLRMDAISRAELHKVRLETKTRTVNEVRKIEDEEPFKGEEYDRPGIPADPAPAAPAMRALTLDAEARQMPQETRTAPDMHFHLPESVQVEMRQEHLTAAIERMADGQTSAADIATAVAAAVGALPAPVVNVTTPTTPVQLTLDMPAPVFNIPPANVTVNLPEEPQQVHGPQVKTVKLKVGDKTVTGTITETE